MVAGRKTATTALPGQRMQHGMRKRTMYIREITKDDCHHPLGAVSYTHLTLPTKRIV